MHIRQCPDFVSQCGLVPEAGGCYGRGMSRQTLEIPDSGPFEDDEFSVRCWMRDKDREPELNGPETCTGIGDI